MDPIAYLLATYLNVISTSVANHYEETRGLELQAVVIEHKGYQIGFQHQYWKIKDESVCLGYSHDLLRQSKCSVEAKSLFTSLCAELSQQEKKNPRYGKYRNMYCQASVSYQPIIAQISAGKEKSDVKQAWQNCNRETVAAMGSSDPGLIAKRNQACQHYNDLMNAP